MSGTVNVTASSARLAHIFFECAIISKIRRIFRIAAIVAAIFIFTGTLVVLNEMYGYPGMSLEGCGPKPPDYYKVDASKLQIDSNAEVFK